MGLSGRAGAIGFVIVFGGVFLFFHFGQDVPTHIADRGTTQAFTDAEETFYFLEKRAQKAVSAGTPTKTFATLVTEAELAYGAKRPVVIQGYDRKAKDYVEGLLDTDLIKLRWPDDHTHATYGIEKGKVSCFVRGVFNFGQVAEERYPQDG